MPPAPRPENEFERLAALHQSGVLASGPEPAFDDLARLAAFLCDTPIGLVSLVDEVGQRFKAAHGLSARHTHRDFAFCAYTILQDDPLIVPNATQDPRFSDNPLVTTELHLRFYAGVPLRLSDGLTVGSLCVLDTKPRTIAPAQLEDLVALGRQAVAQLDLRRTRGQMRERDEHAAAALRATSSQVAPAAVELREVLDLLRPLGTSGEFASTDIASALSRLDLALAAASAAQPTSERRGPGECIHELLQSSLLPDLLRTRVQCDILVPLPEAKFDAPTLTFILAAMTRSAFGATHDGPVRLWVSTGLAHGRTLLRFDALDAKAAAPLADEPLLSLARHLAHRLGGTLTSAYVEGEGGTLTLTLPAPKVPSLSGSQTTGSCAA